MFGEDNGSINKNELNWIPGKLEIVKYLVEKGAEINSRSNTGKTALYLSASQGN